MPSMNNMLASDNVINAEVFESSNEDQQESSVSLRQPNDISSQGGLVPNGGDDSTPSDRNRTLSNVMEVDDHVTKANTKVNVGAGVSTTLHPIAAGSATMGNNNEQKQQNFQQQHN